LKSREGSNTVGSRPDIPDIAAGAIALFATVKPEHLGGLPGTEDVRDPNVRRLLSEFSGVDWGATLELAAMFQVLLHHETPVEDRRTEPIFIRDILLSDRLVAAGRGSMRQRQIVRQIAERQRLAGA
jgi:hypothetical protein